MNKTDIVFSSLIILSIAMFYEAYLHSKLFYDKNIFLGNNTIISLQYGLSACVLLSFSIVGLLTRWNLIKDIQNKITLHNSNTEVMRK